MADAAAAVTTPRLRPPAGVVVIAALWLLAACAIGLLVLLLIAAPDRLQPYGFPTDASRRAFGIPFFLLAGALAGGVGYYLLRLREWIRRALVLGLPIQAFIAVMDLFKEQDVELVAADVVLIVASIVSAVYLSRPNVKRAFKPAVS